MIEATESATVVTGTKDINMFMLLAARGALGLEIRTGMVPSNRGPSLLSKLQAAGITAKRTKKGAWTDLDNYIVANGGPEASRKPF